LASINTTRIEAVKSFLSELKLHKTGLLGLGVLILYVFVAIFAPWISPVGPNETGWPTVMLIPHGFPFFQAMKICREI